MAHKTPFWFQVTVLLGALSAGCAAPPASPKTASTPKRDCAGGAISSAAGLARLVGCTAIMGDLTIAHTNLRDLTLLRSLERVSGRVTIAGNAQLEDLRGLEGIRRLRGLEIRDNGIHSTSGLDGLREVGKLSITDNRSLISLAGLNGLQLVGSVTVERNPLLCAKFGLLDGLVEVEQKLSLADNYGISDREAGRLYAQVGLDLPSQLKLGLQEYASFEH